MSVDPDPLDLELAQLGAPLEAAPVAGPAVLLARAGVAAAPIVVGLAGWKLYGLVGLVAASSFVGGVIMPLPWTGLSLENSQLPTTDIASTTTATARPPDDAWLFLEQTVPWIQSAPPAEILYIRVPTTDLVNCIEPTPAVDVFEPMPADDTLDATLAALPDDDPADIPALDAVIGPQVATLEPDRSQQVQQTWIAPAELRLHLEAGPRGGLSPRSEGGGLGAGAGVTLYARAKRGLGPSVGAQTDLGWLGNSDRMATGRLTGDVGYGLRREHAAIRAGWGLGASWRSVPDNESEEGEHESNDSRLGPQKAPPAAQLEGGVVPITGPSVALSLGTQDRGSFRVASGLTIPIKAPPAPGPGWWAGIGLDIPIGKRSSDSPRDPVDRSESPIEPLSED